MASSRRPAYLLDTNVLVHLIRGGPLAEAIDARFGLRAGLARAMVSVVTVGELRSLALQLGWGKRKRAELAKLTGAVVVVDINRPEVLDAYAELDDFSRRAGRSPGKNDLWIAATARATGAVLLTTDKDFDHLTGDLLQRHWIDPAPA